jgi:hypothetical protein
MRNNELCGSKEKRDASLNLRVSIQMQNLPIQTATSMLALNKTARIWTCHLTVQTSEPHVSRCLSRMRPDTREGPSRCFTLKI